MQPFRRPEPVVDWFAPPPDLSPVPEGLRAYDWDPSTGLSRRIIPGQPGGMFTATGLAHDEASRVAYRSDINERGSKMRSRKIAVLQQTLQPPVVNGEETGDLLLLLPSALSQILERLLWAAVSLVAEQQAVPQRPAAFRPEQHVLQGRALRQKVMVLKDEADPPPAEPAEQADDGAVPVRPERSAHSDVLRGRPTPSTAGARERRRGRARVGVARRCRPAAGGRPQ